MNQNINPQPMFSSTNSTYIISGKLKKRQSKDNKDNAILYVDIASRVICIQKEEVSSVTSDPKSVIEKLKDDNENLAFYAVISSQESDNKQVCLTHLSNIKAVRKNGKNMLRMIASANKFDSSGKFAQDSINLDQLLEGKKTMTILAENDDDFEIETASASLSEIVERIARAQHLQQNPLFIFRPPLRLHWRNLPGSRPIGRVQNWEYLAFLDTNDGITINTNGRVTFTIRGADSNGNIIDFNGVTSDEFRNNIRWFGIEDTFETWRQQSGRFFGL
jgi:hypothetical protein